MSLLSGEEPPRCVSNKGMGRPWAGLQVLEKKNLFANVSACSCWRLLVHPNNKRLQENQVIAKAVQHALWQVIVMTEILYEGVLISP